MVWDVASLRDALRSKDKKQVAEIVSAQIHVSSGGVNYQANLDKFDYTMLMVAVEMRNRTTVQLLLGSGADPNIVGGKFGTALVAAAYDGHKEMVHLLSENGADVNKTGGGDYGTPLIAAAYRRDNDMLCLLLDKGADVNNTGGGDYGTALIAATYRRNNEMIQLLLEKGADVNIGGGTHGTALGAAVCCGYKEIVQLFLEKGADINSNIGGGKYGTALSAAAYYGHREIVQLLLEKGADSNIAGGRYNYNALAAAVHRMAIDDSRIIIEELLRIVLILLEAGADPNTSYSVDWGRHHMGAMAMKYTYGSLKWSLFGVALQTCDVLARGGYCTTDGLASMLLGMLIAGAEFNTLNRNSAYLTAVRDLAKRERGREMVSLIFQKGRDVNKVDGECWTLLGQAVLQMDREMVVLLLNEGADANLGGGEYGNPVGVACSLGCMEMVSLALEWGGAVTEDYGSVLSRAASAGNIAVVSEMLDHGVYINSVDGKYGTALGAAVSGGHIETVSMLLKRGASVMRVGGRYHTALGTYPTALDAAASSGDTGLLTLLTEYSTAKEQKPWPPFPMPYTGILEGIPSTLSHPETLHTAVNHTVFTAGNFLTPDQARVACQDLGQEVLISSLCALSGLDRATRERLQHWIRNDIRYFVSHDFDFGLAYAAARMAWNNLNSHSDSDVARHRYSWLERADRLDKARAMEVSRDSAGQELIKAPYSVMPRRVWDLKSNRVVAYNMLHAKIQATHMIGDPVPVPMPVPTRPPFWAISHSWTDDMEAIDTPINGYQWPVPLPRNINLEGVRKDLIGLGAEYVWLDVLCLRQHLRNPSLALDKQQEDEWKLDVPTIGNIYRAAERVVRYFNGLGLPFSENGWDSPRHWLRRAWTLQEIKTENTTHNGGVVRVNVLNTRGKVSGKVTTLRDAIRPVLRLAAEVDSPGGCSVYELAREMAKRYSTQPTDKVAGLLYLLRTSELPTYDQSITDEDAWAKCIPLLPLQRKIELLFDFPYRGLIPGGWFPTWKQVLRWPERDSGLEHTRTGLQNDKVFELVPIPGNGVPPTEFICKVWAISNVYFQETDDPDGYAVLIGDKAFGFYPPYLAQEPIGISNDQPFTLTAMSLDQSYNWIVCEQVGDREEKYGEKEMLVDVIILRKIGVLRTDSCSELSLVVGDHKLKEIRSVFI